MMFLRPSSIDRIACDGPIAMFLGNFDGLSVRKQRMITWRLADIILESLQPGVTDAGLFLWTDPANNIAQTEKTVR